MWRIVDMIADKVQEQFPGIVANTTICQNFTAISFLNHTVSRYWDEQAAAKHTGLIYEEEIEYASHIAEEMISEIRFNESIVYLRP